MTRRLTLQRITPLNHSVFHLVFDRPEGLAFTPGQAVDMALDRDGWRETRHPFTFTSLPSEEAAEFVIKTYPEDAEGHEGMTARIARMIPCSRIRSSRRAQVAGVTPARSASSAGLSSGAC